MPDNNMTISIIVPVRNEAEHIQPLLNRLAHVREQVVLVDGQSTDETVSLCEAADFRVVTSEPGRATQMNVGARYFQADYYWFLHADCLPSDDVIQDMSRAAEQGCEWGRFNVRLTGEQPVFRVIEWLMNRRSCLTQVATGDQGIFVSARLFNSIGGFPDIPLMEDVVISKLLRRQVRGCCLRSELAVSSRRWQDNGIIRTIFLMWWLRLRFVMGVDPVVLHRDYYVG